MVKIIAEAGINHNGNLAFARALVNVARQSLADAIKFQTFDPKQLVTQWAPLASYQEQNLGHGGYQHQMLESVRLSESDHMDLKNLCDDVGIEFMSTPFDEKSLDFLLQLGCKTIKISSGDLTNIFLLEAVARENLQTILSTGMAEEREIVDAMNCLTRGGLSSTNLTLLHCTTEYPCPIEDVNLNAIPEMRIKFGVDIGYSDHTDGISVAVAAVALGATVIEKHFTLDRNESGPDHKASLEPKQLTEMITAIRDIELALGDGVKRSMPSEQKNSVAARKSLVASRAIMEGEVFSRDNLTAKRPGDGLNPMSLSEVIGSPASRDYKADEQIER